MLGFSVLFWVKYVQIIYNSCWLKDPWEHKSSERLRYASNCPKPALTSPTGSGYRCVASNLPTGHLEILQLWLPMTWTATGSGAQARLRAEPGDTRWGSFCLSPCFLCLLVKIGWAGGCQAEVSSYSLHLGDSALSTSFPVSTTLGNVSQNPSLFFLPKPTPHA